MHFGLMLPSHWPNPQPAHVRSVIEESALAAAELGFQSVWTNDHVVAPAQNVNVGHTVDAFVTLSSLIHLVPTLDLGMSVLVLPQRHAVVVAKQAATLDVLSNGRFRFGVGTGWQAEEFRFLNASFEQRGKAADEAITLMRQLWREPQTSFSGQWYSLSDAVMEPKPVQKHIPLWVGGNTTPAIRRAARLGDVWMPFQPSVAELRAGAELLRNEASGRDIPLAMHARIYIGSGPEAAQARLSGSPAAIAEALREYQRAGLKHLICDFVADSTAELIRQAQQLQEQVAPLFAE